MRTIITLYTVNVLIRRRRPGIGIFNRENVYCFLTRIPESI